MIEPANTSACVGKRFLETPFYAVRQMMWHLRNEDHPEVMGTDQGSYFTSIAWTDRLRHPGVRSSMDGKGRFLDTILVERLWRSLSDERV